MKNDVKKCDVMAAGGRMTVISGGKHSEWLRPLAKIAHVNI